MGNILWQLYITINYEKNAKFGAPFSPPPNILKNIICFNQLSTLKKCDTRSWIFSKFSSHRKPFFLILFFIPDNSMKMYHFFTQIDLCFFPPQNSREMSIFCPGLLLPFSLRENVCFSKDTNSARQTDRLLTDRWLTDRLLTDRLLTDWRTDRRTDRRMDAGIGGGDSFL